MSTSLIDNRTIAEAADALEPLPASVTRLAGLVSDPDIDLESVVEVISYDPALAGDVLRRANSAASAPRSPIVDVGQAAARLGSAAILTMAMGHAVGHRMSAPLEIYGLSPGELWRHSVATAISAEVVRSKSSVAIPPQAVTAALLHDIGKMVLARCVPPDVFAAIRQVVEEHRVPLAEAEQHYLGTNHADVGRVVAVTWSLPLSIQIGITRHHTADQVSDVVARAVGVADMLSDGVVNCAAGMPMGELETPEGFHDTAAGLFADVSFRELVELSVTRFATVSEQYL